MTQEYDEPAYDEHMLDPFTAGMRSSQRFHNSTKFTEAPPEPDPTTWPSAWTKTYYKGYPRLPAFALPKPFVPKRASLLTALSRRESAEEFGDTPLTAQDLSALLYYSAGINRQAKRQGAHRYYPSAGGRYPLEVYPVIFAGADPEPGVYHYYVREHALETLEINRELRADMASSIAVPWMRNASVVLVISAVFERSLMKYGERGYRHTLVEVGHLCQNLYLLSSALSLTCCSAGGYVDDAWNRLLDLDGREETVVGTVFFGRPQTREPAPR